MTTPKNWHFVRHPINHTCEIHDEHGCFGTVHRDSAQLVSASPDLLTALELDAVFHSRPFCRQSMPEFVAAGYTGSDDGGEMKRWLWDVKQAAIAKATGGAK